MNERNIKVEAEIKSMVEKMTPREREILLEEIERRDKFACFNEDDPRYLIHALRSLINAEKP